MLASSSTELQDMITIFNGELEVKYECKQYVGYSVGKRGSDDCMCKDWSEVNEFIYLGSILTSYGNSVNNALHSLVNSKNGSLNARLAAHAKTLMYGRIE
ncbi:unnamed protein product [Arctia plantaginis]|uniref:Uncharacterized protein n=1 Tax=Arctia plantaginis TaxID=874455 RepID=A0A8S0YZ15_ARCPL|nr:unnamed protein product [Arctia plantaginis]CAB3256620.1 unnamed protein product [Arctia plantaginis]